MKDYEEDGGFFNNATEDYTMIDSNFLCRDDISFAAKGLMCYLCSKPAGWELSLDNMTAELPESKRAISFAMEELKKCGALMVSTIGGKPFYSIAFPEGD